MCRRLPSWWGLIEDLLAYLNGATHGSLIQAALVHAQFESIHPFTDGNGRVGRALIHTVLTRRGLTPSRVLPVSLVLSRFRDSYVAALNALRFEGAASMPENAQAVNEWNERLESYRDSLGYTRKVRSDSAVSQILPHLAGSPVLTIKTASEIHGLSPQKAHEALTQLRGAGIMTTKTIARGRHAYIAHEVLDLITFAERALASTRFDTRVNPPNRQVPARPAGA
ncbi:Fic family protein [Trueperella pyogenes]|uniref:Fic family protein n=1 Tax=Trueperella pyogenes TaxID=1661 RepID=UPI00345DAC56